MKPLLCCLLVLAFAACNPFPKDEAPVSEKPTRPATPAVSPTPKPGDWMWQKRENKLGPEGKDDPFKPSGK